MNLDLNIVREPGVRDLVNEGTNLVAAAVIDAAVEQGITASATLGVEAGRTVTERLVRRFTGQTLSGNAKVLIQAANEAFDAARGDSSED